MNTTFRWLAGVAVVAVAACAPPHAPPTSVTEPHAACGADAGAVVDPCARQSWCADAWYVARVSQGGTCGDDGYCHWERPELTYCEYGCAVYVGQCHTGHSTVY